MSKSREIKRRIRSVDNTCQITKTMEKVAAAKIKKAQERIESARPYALKMMDVLYNVAHYVSSEEHPLLEVHDPIEKVLIVTVSSNRGLCGAFNSNVIRKSESIYRSELEKGRKVAFVVIGKKALSYFKYCGYPIAKAFTEMDDFPTYQDAAKIGQDLINIYNSRKVDKIYLVFNHFKSAMEHHSVEYVLLPIQQDEVINQAERSSAAINDEYIFEPSPKDVLFSLLPNYIETLVFRALMESSASENGARRTAMKSASDNANEIIDNLKRSYNRMRQAQITQEIAEVVGGAEALRT